ncbi:Protein of unknown function [Gryllus bimaculatus]|nr:Protein of unknown function [Gryllus bimaculatus]
MEEGYCTVPGLGVTSPRDLRRTYHSAVFAHMTDPSAAKSGFPPPAPPPAPRPRPTFPHHATQETALENTYVPIGEAEEARMYLKTEDVSLAQPQPTIMNIQTTTNTPDFHCSCKQGRQRENLPRIAAERTTIRILHPPGGPSSE